MGDEVSAVDRGRAHEPLSLWQTMLLQGVLPIVLGGVILPIGLIAFFLAINHSPVTGAVDHGELFLAASNAGFIGCVTLVASRTDRAVNAMIASMFVLFGIVVPGYACWALLTVEGLLNNNYSEFLAVAVGGGLALTAMVVSLVFVRLPYHPPE